MGQLPNSVDGILSRLIELVKDDEELHNAVVRAINAYGHHQEAMADHKHSLAALATERAEEIERKKHG